MILDGKMIPKQLKDMAFCRVLFKDKKPFENGWQAIYHSYEDIQKYFPKENYGVLTGFNYLAVLDDDTEDRILLRLFEKNFSKTFRVRDHYYFKVKNMNKKIILYKNPNKRNERIHLGEIQWKGQMVVGAGSIHPSGEKYNLVNDCEIIEIDYNKLIKVFKEYIPEIKKFGKISRNVSFNGEDINSLNITSIFNCSGLIDKGNGIYQGPHPVHGSDTGMNFLTNSFENIWCCYRCGTGGGIWTAIAVNENIIDCSDCVKGFKLNEEQRKKVIKLAWEHYGLKKPESDLSSFEPKGWANSINIKKMAERNNILNCPNCNVPFEFNERLGWYKCNCCGIKGGIKEFLNFCN